MASASRKRVVKGQNKARKSEVIRPKGQNKAPYAIKWILTKRSITVSLQGKTTVLRCDDPAFNRIVAAARNNRADLVRRYLVAGTAAVIVEELGEKVSYKNGTLYLNGKEMHNYITQRISPALAKDRVPWLMRFIARGSANPSTQSFEQLFRFLETRHFPITEKGTVLAYKGVFKTNDPEVFVSAHDKKTKHIFGKPTEVDRKDVVANDMECAAYGLHLGCWSQARGHGDTMLIVEFDPADSVCVPRTENSKVRVCRYIPRCFATREFVDPLMSLEEAIEFQKEARAS